MSTGSRTNQQSIKRFFAPANVVELQEGEMVNPFPSGLGASLEDIARASMFAKAAREGSRKGKKQKRYDSAKKRKVCIYIKQNTGCNRDFVGMKVLGEEIPATTVKTWWSQFQNDPHNQSHWDGPEDGLKWPEKPLGRPVSVPKIVVAKVDKYFDEFRAQGLQLTRELTRATMRMAFKELNLRLPKSLAASSRAFLRLRNYTIRTVTNTATDLNEEHVELMNEFRSKLQRIIQELDVAPEDILNSDETGIQVIPTYKRTLAKLGSKQVPGVAKKAMAQITKVSAATSTGLLLPYMLIFAGKTDKVLPACLVEQPEGVVHTFTPSHFANAVTTLEYVKKIIVPFVTEQRRTRVASGGSTEARENSRWAVLIWDNFSPHGDDPVIAYLTAHRVRSLFLPPRCTSLYQPLDVLINGAEKRLLTKHFSEWHFKALDVARRSQNPNYNVLPRTAASKRAFIATLVAGVHRMMAGRTVLIKTAWHKSTVLQSDHNAMDVDLNLDDEQDNQLDKELLQQMALIAIDSDQGTPNDEDEFSDATCSQDAPDFAEHFHDIDLHDNPIDEEEDNELQTIMQVDEQGSDSEESYAPSITASTSSSCNSRSSAVSHSSLDSCGQATLSRPASGGELAVSFIRGGKLEPDTFMALLVPKLRGYRNVELIGVSEDRLDGYNIKLRGVPHGHIAQVLPSMVWMPHELDNNRPQVTKKI